MGRRNPTALGALGSPTATRRPHLRPQERLVLMMRHPWTRVLGYKGLKLFGVEIPATVEIGDSFQLAHGSVGLVIHKTTKIGNNVKVFQGVTIGFADEHLPIEELLCPPRYPGGVRPDRHRGRCGDRRGGEGHLQTRPGPHHRERCRHRSQRGRPLVGASRRDLGRNAGPPGKRSGRRVQRAADPEIPRKGLRRKADFVRSRRTTRACRRRLTTL